MGDFRIVYGKALGKEGNFQVRTDGLFAQADTTPDVSNGTLFYTNNTTNTVITNFDLSWNPQTATVSHFEGKEIKVLFLDNSTSLASNSRILLASTNGNFTTNSSIDFLYHNSAWYETGRSISGADAITVESKNLVSVSASTGGVDVKGNIKAIFGFSSAGSPLVIRKAFNGAQGQQLTLVSAGPSDMLVIVNSGAADTFYSASTSGTQFRLASSAAVTFVRYLNKWHEIVPISASTAVTVWAS